MDDAREQSKSGEGDKMESTGKESTAEVERAKEQTENEQVQIEPLKAVTRAMLESIGGVKADGPSQQLPAGQLELALETDKVMRLDKMEVDRLARLLALSEQQGALQDEALGTAKMRLKEQVDLLAKLVALSEEQGTLQAEQVKIARRNWWIAIVSIILVIVGIIIAIIVGRKEIGSLWNKIGSLQSDVKQSQFVITSPTEGQSVGLGQWVRGKTKFPELNHYIIVTVVRTGTAYVQNKPAFVNPDGTFSGDARFGNQGAGEDDEFRIRVLAIKATLPAGLLAEVPSDAIFSDFVTVRRVQPPEKIVITSPTAGADVDFDDRILGKTPFPELNHYIVVTPVRVGTAFVQDQPASVNRADGTFSGTARFGGVEVGVGEQFIVRVLATKSTLPASPLTPANVPGDAVYSNSVSVRRRK